VPWSDEDDARFEQYKLAIEMADRISARRGTANAFYFTVSSALLATSESLGLRTVAAAGLVLACTWWLQLASYRKLSAAKWKVINQVEADLPARPFSEEWKLVKAEPVERRALRSARVARALSPLARYTELSVVEQVVPAIFFALFLVSLIQDVT
jgi:hypothetical protein